MRLRWSREASISFMDDAGIDVAVVSLSTPGVHTGDSAKARALARMVQRILGRTDSFTTGPVWRFRLPPLAGCRCLLEELSYALVIIEYNTKRPHSALGYRHRPAAPTSAAPRQRSQSTSVR